jgi:transcription initiation factor TFIIH subunit 4
MAATMFEFFSKNMYDDTVDEAKRYDGLLLAVPEKKWLFIDPRIKDAIRDFVVGQQRQHRGM